MSNGRGVCVVTIHGIGFQQPPHDGVPGYADGLHAHLDRVLRDKGVRLGSDPSRGHGPVYVRSAKPGTRDTEWGLSRLGTWNADGTAVGIADAPLTAGDEPVTHVAVVYNPLEGVGPRLLSGGATLAEAGLRLGHYASVTGAIRLAISDTWTALHQGGAPLPHETPAVPRQGQAPDVPPPSLRPRDDVAHGRPLLKPREASGRPRRGAGLPGVIRTLEDDVVAYVARNDLREPVRRFVAEVLRRVAARPDVEHVVVNAHSQGTVVAFDVLRDYPAESRVRALVTAGSPLRKYVDLFSWGGDAGGIQAMTWLNFWDARDPVADPLDPPPDWHFGDAPERAPGRLGLLWAAGDAGAQAPVTIRDRKVDNVRHSSAAGLRAHNYWGNTAEVIPALGGVVENTLLAGTPVA